MKKIFIRRIEVRNFKATASQVIDNIPNGGFIVSGHNGSGKSSILQAVEFCLDASCEAQRVINQTTKAPASVSLTIEHPDGVDTFTRTLTPTLDASGKVTASTSSYVISGVPCKKTEYDIRINQLFGTRDWQYLLNPSLVPFLKEARAILLQVAGAPEERAFLAESNPTLANIIGNTSFSDFEKKEKQVIESLGKRISTEIPAKIEELSAMLQDVEEIDTTGVEGRIKAINIELAGVDAENATRADAFSKISTEAQSLRAEAQNLRNLAAQKVSEANKEANKQADEADELIAEWNRTLAGLRRQADNIKSEMSEARQSQATKEKQLADVNAEIQVIANQCREISARVPSANGQCSACGVYCAQLQAKGIEAAIAANGQELDRTKAKGRATVAQRDQIKADLEAIAKKIDGLMSMEHEVEARINALGEAPTAPERKVIESTPESLHLISQAEAVEEKATKLIQSNRLNIAQKPTELVNELQTLNETLTRGAAARQAQKNNDKINERISELREEESALITTQLQYKQHIAQLKEFYKAYADSVTASVNKLFDGTGYEIRLFETNMSNDKGVPVMQPMKDGSTNLCRSESVIFGKFFVERVLAKHWDVNGCAPMLFDDTESLDSTEKLRSEHQVIATRVERHALEITNIE